MGEYFKPWRRKFGVITLALACVLMAVWMRSLTYLNSVVVSRGDFRIDRVRSTNGCLFWERFQSENPISLWSGQAWVSIYGSPNSGVHVPFFFGYDASSAPSSQARTVEEAFPSGMGDIFPTHSIDWRWRAWGFGLGRCDHHSAPSTLIVWVVPYWAVVLLLTLLSAWLLLSKPRPNPTKLVPDYA